MKFTYLAFLLLSFSVFSASPFLKGQKQSGVGNVSATTIVPENQSTKINASQALLETGNKNLLVNPSFEHATFSTGWEKVQTGGVVDLDPETGVANVSPGGGLKSTLVTFTGAKGGYRQCVLTGGKFAGTDIIAGIWVKTDQSGLYVNGYTDYNIVESTPVSNNNQFSYYEVRFPAGITNACVSLETANANGIDEVSVTGLAYVDSAKLEPDEKKWFVGNLNTGARIVGTMTFPVSASNDSDCSEIPSSTNWTLPDQAGCDQPGVTSGDVSFAIDNTRPSINLKTVKGSKYIVTVRDIVYKTNSASSVTCKSGISIDGGSSTEAIRAHHLVVSSTSSASNTLGESSFKLDGDGSEINIQYRVQASISSSCEFMTRLDALELRVTEYPATNPYLLNTGKDFFSTNTNTLTWVSDSNCDQAEILGDDKIGYFSTCYYGSTGSNTRSGCTSAPSQSVSDFGRDGFHIYSRPYVSTQNCSNPPAIAINIGKGKKGVSKTLFKNPSSMSPRLTSNFENYYVLSNVSRGVRLSSYDPSTGILLVDAGMSTSAVTDSAGFQFEDQSVQSDGYLVIEASTNAALPGFNLEKLPGMEYVYVEAAGNTGQTITADVTNIPFTELTDEHNLWNGSQFTVPEDGTYTISTRIYYTNSAQGWVNLFLGGASYKRIGDTVNSTNHGGQYTGKFLKGQVLSIRARDGSLSTSGGVHYLTITKIPGWFR